MLTIAAREIKIEITCPDGVQPLGFIGRSEKFENRKASVNLSQFTLGQSRYLLLRCLVTRPEPEVARVNVRYTDELDNGSEQSSSGVVKIRYTDDQAAADRSINSAVNADIRSRFGHGRVGRNQCGGESVFLLNRIDHSKQAARQRSPA